MEFIEKIVDFSKYCKICQFEDYEEDEEPCFECLRHPVNINSRKPVRYKTKELASKDNE